DVACPNLEEAEGGGGGEEEEEEKEDDGGEEEQPVEEEEEEEAPLRINRVDDGSGVLVVERDLGLRCQLWDLPVNDQEKARKAYVKCGAYHFKKEIYPPTGPESHPRRFQYHWFKAFPWLEYSPTVAVDQQLHELNCRFSEQATEILILCNSLNPKDSFSSLNIDDVCSLASKYYPADFSEQERNNLRCQLQHYELDVPTNPRIQNLSSVGDLCQQLAKTGKSVDYYLIDRLIRLVLTLPVSTATTERAFSAMKVVKTRLQNKMEDMFLRDCLLIYIEKEIAVGFSTDAIIDEFNTTDRRVDFE
uniref:HAT C-terminal dimerisation domain-containing protein n=1 Tax=Triticum urartu TaxID=4572 RepID=A0A8R7PKM9_TRIUA